MTGKTINILAVDDDPVLCQLIVDVFKAPEFHVLKAGDGVEALRLIADSPDAIDVLLLDVVMPRMSGTELTRVLLTWHPEIKIIFMSGYDDDVLDRHGIPASRLRCLKKPFNPDDLERAVRDELKREN
jgi:two-component system cell cycle sensor histidine kinase/response regulator CckA